MRLDTVVFEVIRHLAEEDLTAAGLSLSQVGGVTEGATLLFGGRRERFAAGGIDDLVRQLEPFLTQAAEDVVGRPT